MASPAVDIATGITIEFVTSGFSAEVTDIRPPGMSRESVDVTKQTSTAAREFTPSDLYDGGEFSFDGHLNPDTFPPINAAAETIRLKFTSGTWWTFTGFATGYELDAPLEGKMTFTMTVKVSGRVSIDVDGSGTGTASAI